MTFRQLQAKCRELGVTPGRSEAECLKRIQMGETAKQSAEMLASNFEVVEEAVSFTQQTFDNVKGFAETSLTVKPVFYRKDWGTQAKHKARMEARRRNYHANNREREAAQLLQNWQSGKSFEYDPIFGSNRIRNHKRDICQVGEHNGLPVMRLNPLRFDGNYIGKPPQNGEREVSRRRKQTAKNVDRWIEKAIKNKSNAEWCCERGYFGTAAMRRKHENHYRKLIANAAVAGPV